MSVDAQSLLFRALPPVSTTPIETAAREVPASKVRVPGGASFIGARAAFGMVVGDRIVLPLFGLGYARAISGTPVRASLDGSIADLHVARSQVLSISLPGIGVRFKHRRWMAQAVVHTGYTFFSVPGSVAAAGDAHPFAASARSFALRLELEGCRRLDPTTRACLFVAPSIYELGWASGAQVGLRWEVGP